MGTSQPVMGYRSKTEAVFALRRQNLSTRQIAERLGITPSNVTALEGSAMRSERAEKHGVLTDTRFPQQVRTLLRPPALKRAGSVGRRLGDNVAARPRGHPGGGGEAADGQRDEQRLRRMLVPANAVTYTHKTLPTTSRV